MKNVLKKISLFSVGFFTILYCNNVAATTAKRTHNVNATTAKNLSKQANLDKQICGGLTPNTSFPKLETNDSSQSKELVINYENIGFYENPDNIDFYKNMYKDVQKVLAEHTNKNTSNLIDEISTLVSSDKINRLKKFFKMLSAEPINDSQNKTYTEKEIVDKNMKYFIVYLREYRKIASVISITHLHVLITCALNLDFTTKLTIKEISDTIKDCYNPATPLYQLSRTIFKQRVDLANAVKINF